MAVVNKSQLSVEIGQTAMLLQAPKQEIEASLIPVEGVREVLARWLHEFALLSCESFTREQ
jgi:hypothetical protein